MYEKKREIERIENLKIFIYYIRVCRYEKLK